MFILIFEQLVKMFLIMLLAFCCYKIRLVDQHGNRTISNLLLLVVNPLLILNVYQTDYDPDLVNGLMWAFAAAFLSHIAAVVLGTLLIRGRDRADCCIERFNAVYSNCGFIGIPLLSSVLGDTGVFYLTAYMVTFTIFSWTHGVVLMENRFSLKSLKEGILSPSFLAALAALLLFFLQIRLPSVLLDSMEYVADMNTPLAMMVAGFSVAQADLPAMFRNLRMYFVCLVKLIVIPAVMLLILMVLPVSSDVATTILIATACPAAATGTMMAIRYGRNYTYSSEIFALSTLLSLVTIPAVVFAAELLL